MAQLPPKIPTMSSNWSLSPHQRAPTPHSHMQPSWMDDFLDFSSVKRGAHRRSASDSIAFLEAPLVQDSRGSLRPEFDGLDDEQLMSMFPDDTSPLEPATLSSSNPSSPSDHNSMNDDKPITSDHHPEVQSFCKSEMATPLTTAGADSIKDPKRVKRILANRQSAQRSRVRKLQYISELERSVTSLQELKTEVSVLSPRVAFLDHQRLILNVDNSALKQRLAALAQDKIFKDAHQEALRKEIERLRGVYHQQKVKKTGNIQQQQDHLEEAEACRDELRASDEQLNEI